MREHRLDSFSDSSPVVYKVQTDDGVSGATDNCAFDANPSQANTEGGPPPAGNIGKIDNGPGVGGDDLTVPNGDVLEDACDAGKDHDGLPDSRNIEPLGATGICAAFDGSSDGHTKPLGP